MSARFSSLTPAGGCRFRHRARPEPVRRMNRPGLSGDYDRRLLLDTLGRHSNHILAASPAAGLT
jgi:hypothetical protein